MDWDWIDDDDGDVFDRLGSTVFGGYGLVATLYRSVISPTLSISRKVYRHYLRGIINYVLTILAALVAYEMFINRRIHERVSNWLPCCQKQKRQRVPDGALDIARQERIRHIQERLSKKAED